MTRVGMCGSFCPDRVLEGWWKSQSKASDFDWVGRYIRVCGRDRYISACSGVIIVV